jgi:hypothetical protein
MSTKSTIAYGPNFHLYHEVLDEDFVYLELEGAQFEAGYNRVMVPIPIHIWEVIRQYRGTELTYAAKTDAELSEYVEHEVAERLARFETADEKSRNLVSVLGSGVYGRADDPRERQIAAGIEYFTKVREHEQQIKQAIEELQKMNLNTREFA